MHELYELKEMLCKELEEYGQKEMTTGSLEVVDKLANTVKNLGKIIEMYDEEYSNENRSYNSYRRNDGRVSRRGSYGDGVSYRNDGSYARGRNANRDSRGRYSSNGYSMNDELVDQLEDLMQSAPDEKTRKEFERFIKKIEMM